MPRGSKQVLFFRKMDFDTKTLRRILENCSYRDWRMLRLALQRTESEEEECALAPVEKFKRHRWLSHRFLFMLRRKGGWRFTGYYNSVDNTTTRYSYVKGLQWNCDPKYPDLFICSITNIVVVGFHRTPNGMPAVTRLDIADPTQFYTPGKADVKKLPTDHPWCTELRSARLKRKHKAIKQ